MIQRYKNDINCIVYDGRSDPNYVTDLMICDCGSDLRWKSFQGFYELYEAIDYGPVIMIVHNEGTTLVCKKTYEIVSIVYRVSKSIVYNDKIYRWHRERYHYMLDLIIDPLNEIKCQRDSRLSQIEAIDPVVMLMRSKIIDRRLINYGTDLLLKNKARKVQFILAFIDVLILFER